MTLQQLEQPVALPLWEDPPGVYRIGKSCVLLELVIRAYQRGESPEAIVRSYRTLDLANVYAIISRYLAHPEPFDAYLRECDERAQAVRVEIESRQPPGVDKEELRKRARAKGQSP